MYLVIPCGETVCFEVVGSICPVLVRVSVTLGMGDGPARQRPYRNGDLFNRVK